MTLTTTLIVNAILDTTVLGGLALIMFRGTRATQVRAALLERERRRR